MVLRTIGPRITGPWDLGCLGSKVRGPKVRGSMGLGLIILEPCQVEHGVTLEEVSPPSCSASQAGLIIKDASKTSVTHQLFSSVPCNSLARLNKEVTFAVAASLPVVKLSNLERREERRPKADFDRLMLKVKKLKGFGLGVMGGHGVNSQWVNLTGK